MDSKKTEDKAARKVYELSKASRCHNCDSKLEVGSMAKLKHSDEDSEVFCLTCSGLKTFVVLPPGNARATKMAAKYCPDSHVLWKWSELWKCYERRGLLIDEDSAHRLEAELGIKIPGRP